MPRGRSPPPPKNIIVILKFTIVELSSEGKAVTTVEKSVKDEFYSFLNSFESNIIDRYIKGSALIVEVAVTNKKEADKIGKEIVKESKVYADQTEFDLVLVHDETKEEKVSRKKKSVSPVRYNKDEPVIQLCVMQSSLPREIYMIPVSYFKNNKKIKSILEQHIDVDADVDDTTWAEFHRTVQRELRLNMDKEFKPFIFKKKRTYTINDMWWIDYE